MKIKIKIHPKADIEFIIRVIVAHWIYLPAPSSPPAPALPPLKSPRRIPPTPLQVLSNDWNDAARDKGAAGIQFINDIDDSIPKGLAGFRYLEAELEL